MTAEVLPPQHPSLPRWPEQPEGVDTTGTSWLVLALDDSAADVAEAWLAEAVPLGPTSLGGPDEVGVLLAQARVGVRVMVAGGQHDVLQVLTRCRRAGLSDAELRSFVISEADLPVYCAHCQSTHRAAVAPGGRTTCPTCSRVLEVHEHFARTLGSFLASEVAEVSA